MVDTLNVEYLGCERESGVPHPLFSVSLALDEGPHLDRASSDVRIQV